MALSKSARIGNYEVIRPLGTGGMGEVYVARDLRLNRDVALKFLPQRAEKDVAMVRRFIREAKAASALNHPNIVTIHESGHDEMGHFIVMELVHGTTLRSLIGPVPDLDKFIHLSAQMVRGLSAAHAANIIHRDIKPENLMVRDDGYVKILDFGLARQESPESADQQSTTINLSDGSIMGSPSYMSPEQARGEKLTSASDIFSLGIVFYEFATGHHPFGSGTPLRVVNAILSQDVIPPARLNPELSGTLNSLILRMLERNPRLRPACSEVEEVLTGPAARVVSDVPQSVSSRIVVGRERERVQLESAFESAIGGRGSVVALEGEAGLGKTTLAEQFLGNISVKHQCFIGRGGSSERLAGADAYFPILEALEGMIYGKDGATIAQIMKLLAPTWYVHVSSASASASSLSQVLSQAQAGSQDRLIRELTAFLQEVARSRPFVLFLDDLHWADVSTIDLLVHVAAKLAALRVLIIVAYRPAEMQINRHPFLQVQPDLQSRGLCQTIRLEFLTQSDLQSYVELQFPGHALPPEFIHLLHFKTEGNALFMVDVLRYLKEQKIIAKPAGQWVLCESVPDIDRLLPESVRGMIQRNIDTLEEEQRRLLIVASIQGVEFHAGVIASVLELDPVDVEEHLDRLDRGHGLIRLVSEHSFPNGAVTVHCRFVHVLYQAALYGSLKPARRASLSGSVARALEGFYKDHTSAIASQLAILFESARELDRAAAYFLDAAQGARMVFGYQEAALLSRRGLAVLQSLEITPERRRLELLLRLKLGVSLIPVKGFADEEAQKNFYLAYQFRHFIEPGPELAAVLTGLFEFHIARMEIPTARSLAEQLIELGTQSQNTSLVIRGQMSLGVAMFFSAEFEKALGVLEQTLHQYEAGDYRSKFRFYDIDPGVVCLTLMARSLSILGFLDRSFETIEQAIQLTRSNSDPFSQSWTYFYGAITYQTKPDLTDQKEMIEALMSVASENGLVFWKAHGIGLKGRLLCEEGNLNEGIALMRVGLAAVRATGSRPSLPYFAGLLAEALGQNGSPEEGLKILESEMSNPDEIPMIFSELCRIRGTLLTLLPDRTDEADTWFERAVSTARLQRAKLHELRALTAWARACKKDGRKDEIDRQLISVRESLSLGQATDVLAARNSRNTPDPPDPKDSQQQGVPPDPSEWSIDS